MGCALVAGGRVWGSVGLGVVHLGSRSAPGLEQEKTVVVSGGKYAATVVDGLPLPLVATDDDASGARVFGGRVRIRAVVNTSSFLVTS